MKKLNLGNINAGLNSLKAATDNAAQNGRFELIDTALIDFAAKNSYAADDNEESYKELAANIDEVGLLTPLGVIVNGNRLSSAKSGNIAAFALDSFLLIYYNQIME